MTLTLDYVASSFPLDGGFLKSWSYNFPITLRGAPQLYSGMVGK